jgi:hypothetical protein
MNRIIIVFLVLITAPIMQAQIGSSGLSDARSTGMAGTYNAVSKGSYAFGINPANIIMNDLRGDLLFILPFPQVSLSSSTSFMTLNDFNYYFGGLNGESRFLTTEDKDRFYNFFDNGGEGSFGLTVNLIAFTFSLPERGGALGFAITDAAAGSFMIPQSAIDIPLKGNLINKIYSFDETRFKTWWIRNYSLTYARELPELKQSVFKNLTAGVSLKLVHGYAYAGTEQVNGFVVTSERRVISGRADYLAYSSLSDDIGLDYTFDEINDYRSNLQIFPSPAGTGYGIDLGLSASYNLWNFSLAVTDIGAINWKKRTAMFAAENDIYLDDLANKDQRDSIIRLVEGQGRYIDGFSTSLPLALRAGASYSLADQKAIPGKLILAFDFNQGFNDLPGNSINPRLSFAGDWQPLDWSFIRMGFTFGGLESFSWAAGLGFVYGIMELNFATNNAAALPSPNSSKRLSFAVNSRWRFR